MGGRRVKEAFCLSVSMGWVAGGPGLPSEDTSLLSWLVPSIHFLLLEVVDNWVLWQPSPPFTPEGQTQERLTGCHLPQLQRGCSQLETPGGFLTVFLKDMNPSMAAAQCVHTYAQCSKPFSIRQLWIISTSYFIMSDTLLNVPPII